MQNPLSLFAIRTINERVDILFKQLYTSTHFVVTHHNQLFFSPDFSRSKHAASISSKKILLFPSFSNRLCQVSYP